MMSCYCEICGKEVEKNQCRKIVIEGSILNVCPQCYNRLITQGKARPYVEERKERQPAPKQVAKPVKPRVREEYEVVEDYARRVREARERLGWTQQVLAQKVRESENIIKRIESGRLKPGIDLARRLEKVLGIKLLEPVVEENVSSNHESSEDLTIGDLIRFKRE
ncbi:transcriptional regulator, XRE family [Desulfurococcus amylolyticus DSM 16532]|nr:transcriptional regulator, XRE family [Desulfurococcus amylolyticus DSM 16532]